MDDRVKAVRDAGQAWIAARINAALAKGHDGMSFTPDEWRMIVEALRSSGTGRSEAEVTIPVADYRRLVEASECDDMIVRCGTCGAWLHMDEAAVTDDFTGCPKVAYEDGKEDTCRSYRAAVLEGLAADRALLAQTTGGAGE